MSRQDLEPYLNRLEAAFFVIRKQLAPKPEERGNLTVGQFIVLKQLLAVPGGVPASGLADRLGVSGSAMTGMVDRLEKSGLVARRRGEQDRRFILVLVTAAGRQAVMEAQARRRSRIRQVFSRLGEAQLAALVAAMEGTAETLGEPQSKEDVE